MRSFLDYPEYSGFEESLEQLDESGLLYAGKLKKIQISLWHGRVGMPEDDLAHDLKWRASPGSINGCMSSRIERAGINAHSYWIIRGAEHNLKGSRDKWYGLLPRLTRRLYFHFAMIFNLDSIN